MKLKSDANFEEKLTIGSKNDMRNLVNFNASSGKSEQFHFDIYRGCAVKNGFKNGSSHW